MTYETQFFSLLALVFVFPLVCLASVALENWKARKRQRHWKEQGEREYLRRLNVISRAKGVR